MQVGRFWGLAVMFLVGVWAEPCRAEYHGLFMPVEGATTGKYDLLLVYISETAVACDAFSAPEGGDAAVELPPHAADLAYFYRPRGTRLAGAYGCSPRHDRHSRWFDMLNVTVPGDFGEPVPVDPPGSSICMAEVGKMQQNETGLHMLDVVVHKRGADRVVRATYCEGLVNVF